MLRCPGQDRRYWKPEDVSDVACANCGMVLEFLKTDAIRRCPNCGTRVVNPAVSLGCARWCSHARECLGFDPASLPPAESDQNSLAQRLLGAVKAEFGGDSPRVEHAMRVLDYAEQLLAREGGEPRIVIAAALLHDIGIPAAERKHGSSAPKYQELEGPPIARAILQREGFKPADIDHICRIVGSHHSAGDVDTLEFRIVYDADWLVNLPEACAQADADELEKAVGRIFRTQTGRELARRLYIGREARGD